MKLTAIAISVLALSISVLSFYWSNIRVIKKLYIVGIDSFTTKSDHEFALVNAGTKDVLITSIRCGFESANKNGFSSPKQIIEIDDGGSRLLPAGKSVHCKVTFPDSFTKSFAMEGKKLKNSTPSAYEREMRINISWVEQDGKHQKASVITSKYRFSENGQIRSVELSTYSHNLYTKLTESGLYF